MIDLTQKEKTEIFQISEDFIRIHAEIMEVEEAIKQMEMRSADLIKELESCREREKLFSQELSDKYGDGRLDISGLKWVKLELENAELR